MTYPTLIIMRIYYYITKIVHFFNTMGRKYFGKTSGAGEWIKIFIGMFFASNFYYYLSDHGIPKIVAFLLLTLGVYILSSLLTWIGKYLIFYLKKIRTRNLFLYGGLFYAIYYFLDKLIQDKSITDGEFYGLTALLFLSIVLFSKSLVSLLNNKKIIAILPLVLTLIPIGSFLYYLGTPGWDTKDLSYIPDFEKKHALSGMGNHQVIREEYEGEGVNLLSYVRYSGRKKQIRDRYFNRGLSDVPLRGEIFYPKGERHAPVLFMVHGNHRMTTKNYKGYAYLGEYLASHGIAMVSVDMNMLNGFMKYGLSNENDARAILMLENMDYLLTENNRSESDWYRKFDENKIVLAGHSRGGEAVVLSHLYNSLDQDPDGGMKKLPYDFKIQGLITIAPTYGQFLPSDKEISLKDVNLLTIAGSHDNDITSFAGMKHYDRLQFSGEGKYFKTALYLGYGNHGQFNSLWQDFDNDPPKGLNINRRELLTQKEQQEVTCHYVLSFLDSVFFSSANRELFKRGPDSYEGFPLTTYYTRYQDSSYYNLANFEEDLNIKTASRKGDRIFYKDLIGIYEGAVKNGGKASFSTGVYLTMKEGSTYSLVLEEEIPKKKFFTFDLQNLNFDKNKNLELKIHMTDQQGQMATVNTKDYKYFYPETEIYGTKSKVLLHQSDEKSTPITCRISLQDWVDQNPSFDMRKISKIEFETGKNGGKFLLDNLGLCD
ncbi:MAG: hypothetical protein Q4P25_02230 [Tissierellia bacterium]|nr:hypothetical protein [Tissierellia bacterium]